MDREELTHDEVDEADRLIPDFLIVGTPRSGTTLVQRLASELPGVRVPPETHFFAAFYRGLVKRGTFPLDDRELSRELRMFSNMVTSRDLGLDHVKVIDLLEGRCARPAHMFGAITRSLVGRTEVVGEKTPDHLRWWRPLTKNYPRVKFLFVTRDPRSVVASRIQAGWGASVPELLAARWRADQQEIIRALTSMPDHSRLLLRYEEIVQDPDRTRSYLASFLGVQPRETSTVTEARHLFAPWETWKERALEPVTPDRIDAWTSVLTSSEAAGVINSCYDEMQLLGYSIPMSSSETPRRPLDKSARIARMRFSRWRERMWIGYQRI